MSGVALGGGCVALKGLKNLGLHSMGDMFTFN